MSDLLAPILARKRRENARRRALGWTLPAQVEDRRAAVLAALRGSGGPRVIAEVKFRSPSAGPIRAWSPGEGVRVARAYEAAGAAAVSVLADRAGFGGGALLVRRVAAAVTVPVLFKEFVLDPIQVSLARAVGASMVLLLVRALERGALERLIAQCVAEGLEPVVEAADAREVEIAVETGARVIGVNARDLGTFEVDSARAARAVARIPPDRVRVSMSGIATAEDLARAGDAGADAVLVGTSLMRASDPGARLRALLER